MVGISFAMIYALSYSFVMVASRQLKEIDYSLMLFYYSATALFCFTSYLLFYQISSIFTYTAQQYCFLVMSSLFNVGYQVFFTLAAQNEKSGFISLVGYSGVFYSFIADIAYFEVKFNFL